MARPRKEDTEGLGTILPRPTEETPEEPVNGLSVIGRALEAQRKRGVVDVDDLDEAADDPYCVSKLPKVIDGKKASYVLIAREKIVQDPRHRYLQPIHISDLDRPEFQKCGAGPLDFDHEGFFRLGTRIMFWWPEETRDKYKAREFRRSRAGIAIDAMNNSSGDKDSIIAEPLGKVNVGEKTGAVLTRKLYDQETVSEKGAFEHMLSAR